MQTERVSNGFFVAALIAALLLSCPHQCSAQDKQKAAPPITVIVFDSPSGYDDDVPKVVVRTRDALRDNPRLEVLLFSPSSPSFILAARSAANAITLDNVESDSSQSNLTAAAGGSVYVVLTPTADGKKVSAKIIDLVTSDRQALDSPEDPESAAHDIASKIIADTAEASVQQTAPSPSSEEPVQTPLAAVIPTIPAPAQPVAASPLPDNILPPPIVKVITPEQVQAMGGNPSVSNVTVSAPDQPQTQAPAQQSFGASSATSVPAALAPSASSPGIANISVSMGAPPIAPDDSTLPAGLPANIPTTTPSLSTSASALQSSLAAPDDSLGGDAVAAITEGDAAMKGGDPISALTPYKNAISYAPRAMSPRLKLAQAYLAAGMKSQAVDEAKRALTIDPTSIAAREFIENQGDTGGPSDQVLVAQAETQTDPSNPAAWIALGDAYWNTGNADDSLTSYKRAAEIDENGVAPQTRLAKLYAAKAQYDLSLGALQKSGTSGYPAALEIISSRSESLVGDLDDETDSLIKGTDTREAFYDKIKDTYSQAEHLADFVSKIVPPDTFKVSHLHRELSTKLIAQTVAIWIDYAETNNSDDKSQAAGLEQYAISEMKTASVAEDLQTRVSQ